MLSQHAKGTKNSDAAVRYGKQGFRVIPLRPGRKEPLIDDWPNKATTDEAQIREWWGKWPDANIGILTGRYGGGNFIVLDFDPRNGGDWWDDAGEDVLPPTWVVHTPSGGRHFYYRTPELFRCAKFPDGVDLKGAGGYVVVPPSILLDKDGKPKGEWVWDVECTEKKGEMSDLPSGALAQLAGRGGENGTGDGLSNGAGGSKSGGRSDGGRSLWLMPPPIPKGMRHDYLVSLAGAFWSAGLTEKEVEAILWAALELLETREDFDPVREVEGILKGLQRWEGANYSVGSLLRMLPERTAGVVRRVLTGGVVSGEPVGGVGVGQAAATGRSEKGQGEAEASGRLALASEIVNRLEVRKGADGVFRYVYRTADGAEIEVACAPEGVRDLLAKLGLKLGLKEVKRLLGLAQGVGVDAGAGEAKEKKGRKSKTADKEDIKAILCRYKWVRWQGELWLVAKTKKLLRADLDEIHGLLKENGLDVGKETLRSYYKDLMTDIPKDPLEGIVVTPTPSYGKVGRLCGLWFCHRGDLYLVTPRGYQTFRMGEWPEGVYALDLGMQAVLPDWDGRIEDLLLYWKGVTRRIVGDPKVSHEVTQKVALAMFLPILFGQGHIGLILRGPAKSGKSTLLKALAYLHLGRKPHTPSGSVNMRDIIAALHRRQIAFFDEVNTFSPELQETLKRMITHDGTIMRALYTDLETVETELSGSAVFCATNLEKLASDLRTRCFVWDLAPQGGGAHERKFLEFCAALWRKALAGAIKLYQQAAQLKSPPDTLLPEIRFRDWLAWAYRYAVVLGVEKEFLAFVAKSKRAAHRGDKYEFLLDALSHPDFDPRKEYKITELFELAAPVSDETKRLQHSLGREGVRADLTALALDARYNLRIEKKCATGDKRPRYWFIFTPIDVGEEDFLASLLREAGIEPQTDDDDDDTPSPPTPTPTPPPDNTGAGAGVVEAADAGQDETNPLTDMEGEKKPPPSQLGAGARAAANGLTENIQPAAGATPPSTSAAPPKTDPKKAPPPSEWVYRAGNTPQNANGGVCDGLFALSQDAQIPPPTAQMYPTGSGQEDEYPNDDEIIEFIEDRLRKQAEHGLPLGASLDWLRGFLLLHELKMWELGLKKSYFHIVNRESELQNAIKDLGYDELTPEKDPRLRTPAR